MFSCVFVCFMFFCCDLNGFHVFSHVLLFFKSFLCFLLFSIVFWLFLIFLAHFDISDIMRCQPDFQGFPGNSRDFQGTVRCLFFCVSRTFFCTQYTRYIGFLRFWWLFFYVIYKQTSTTKNKYTRYMGFGRFWCLHFFMFFLSFCKHQPFPSKSLEVPRIPRNSVRAPLKNFRIFQNGYRS